MCKRIVTRRELKNLDQGQAFINEIHNPRWLKTSKSTVFLEIPHINNKTSIVSVPRRPSVTLNLPYTFLWQLLQSWLLTHTRCWPGHSTLWFGHKPKSWSSDFPYGSTLYFLVFSATFYFRKMESISGGSSAPFSMAVWTGCLACVSRNVRSFSGLFRVL